MEILKKDPEVKVTSKEVAAMMFESEYLVRTATGKLVKMDKVIEDRRKGFAAQGGLGQFFSRLLSEMPLLMDRVDEADLTGRRNRPAGKPGRRGKAMDCFSGAGRHGRFGTDASRGRGAIASPTVRPV